MGRGLLRPRDQRARERRGRSHAGALQRGGNSLLACLLCHSLLMRPLLSDYSREGGTIQPARGGGGGGWGCLLTRVADRRKGETLQESISREEEGDGTERTATDKESPAAGSPSCCEGGRCGRLGCGLRTTTPAPALSGATAAAHRRAEGVEFDHRRDRCGPDRVPLHRSKTLIERRADCGGEGDGGGGAQRTIDEDMFC